MTQHELEAGAHAVKEVADKYGYGSYISEDKLREIAAAVINIIDKMRNHK